MSDTFDASSPSLEASDLALETLADDAQDREEEAEAGSASGLGPGETLGRYVVLETLGAGAMGIVYAAYDPQLDRKVALKLLRQDRLHTQTHRERLLREAQAMAKLSHPNVITVHDVGAWQSQVFVAMEYVDGHTLGEWMREPTRDWRQCLEVFRAAGRGLAAAHRAGLIHRDFKPDNVLVDTRDRPRVLDFGLVRRVGDNSELASAAGSAAASLQGEASPVASQALELSESHDLEETRAGVDLTRTGSLMGTPAYMAPEQHTALGSDARSDQFGFCVALWEALYGERPFGGGSLYALQAAVLEGEIREPPGARVAEIPSYIRRSLERGLSTDPGARFADMDALLAALEAPRGAGRSSWWLGAGGLLGAAGIAAAWSMSGTDSEAARDPCAQLERELDGVWDEDLREKLNGKILSIEEPWAEHAAQQTTEQLDEHAGQWLEARSDLCQARRELGEAAAALQGEASCLRRQRLETKALVRLLQEGDESLVKKSVEIVHRLEPASRCADLGQKEELPPEGPQLEAIEAELAQGRAEVAATQWTAAIESFGRAGRAAEAVGAGSLQRQAELREALAHEGKNEHLAAEQGLHEVAAQSLRAGEVERAAHAWAELVGIVGFRLGRAEEALRWASYAREALKDLDRPDLQVRLEHGQALVAYGAGRYGEAQAAFERGLTHYPDPKSPQAANVLNNLGAVAFARGEYQASLDYHQRALAIWRAKFGDRHPDVAISYNNIGSVYEMQGELERAREMLETAMKIRVESLGPESEGVAMGHFNLGVLEEQEGQLERALEHQERAVKIWTQHLGPEHPKVTTARTARGRAYLALGRYEEALADLRMAQAQREGKKEDPIDQAETLFALGRAEVEVPGLGAKERSAGREHIARALAILEEDPELAPDFLKEVRAYPLP